MNIELPLPSFYDPSHAGRWDFRPEEAAVLAAASEWKSRHCLSPAAADGFKLHLLLIDTQKDFCFPQGSLYVGGRSGKGAIEDNDRIARFVYRNLARISEITCTMDTHFPYQIFFASFWIEADGKAPEANREITTADIKSGLIRPNPAVAGWLCHGNYPWLLRQAEHYCEQLEKAGKYRLFLWPPHCLLGSEGHALAGVIQEARLFHAWSRGAKNLIEVKGDNPLTENYSVLAPEVLTRFDGLPLAQRNTRFIKRLLDSDAVILAGQAASHCVKSSIEDLLAEIAPHNPELARKVFIMRDCMSAVAIPNPAQPGSFFPDFTLQAEEALKRFSAAGMNVVDSTSPLNSWPGLSH